ncbi:MAG: hypothetical protein SOR93_03580 [Clostridiales Family XIII bacterium]|uniref:hypothetical protein n=1 Tax=Hominibacterium faecale TaxID=2839743 RepID=UPI0022B2AB83|nr:hypothetical protein [Hominibacterium faecale]MCI7301851.1 hypothetical protein [Clostridia bacterium]MDY3010328.1 hypothetical protein [Clostridiales Family XIII bacterium]
MKCIKEYMVDHFKIGESKIPMIIACDKDNEWTDLIDSCKEGKEYFKTEEMARMRLEELEGAE